MCQLTRIPMTRFNVSFMLQNFPQCTVAKPVRNFPFHIIPITTVFFFYIQITAVKIKHESCIINAVFNMVLSECAKLLSYTLDEISFFYSMTVIRTRLPGRLYSSDAVPLFTTINIGPVSERAQRYRFPNHCYFETKKNNYI